MGNPARVQCKGTGVGETNAGGMGTGKVADVPRDADAPAYQVRAEAIFGISVDTIPVGTAGDGGDEG